MNIIIDLTQIPIDKVGVGVYAIQTFKRVIQQDKNNNYIFIIQNDDYELRSLVSDNLKTIEVESKIFRNFILRFFLEQFYLPYLLLKHKIDIIHSLHYSFPIISFGAKRVVTLHDMTFFIYPKLHIRIKRVYFRFFIWLSTILTVKIITVSLSTSKDLFKFFPKTNPNKVVSIPLAVDLPRVIEKWSQFDNYISFIGTLEPRKNIEKLIQAFNLVLQDNDYDNIRLIIVGKKGWYYQSIFSLVKELELENRVIFTGFVSDEEKFSILKSSKIFVYPSFYEGFGLPVLEAISLGVATITSNISSLPEVAGNDCVLIDPNNENDIYIAIKNVLMDKNKRDHMISNSLVYSKKYSWDTTSLETIKLYNNIARIS